MRVLELFAGIGFQRMALNRLGVEYESLGISEIDKFAIKAYEAIHGETHNFGNIVDIKGAELPKGIDLLTYSFPCTDLSNIGSQKGMTCETQSGLVFEVVRIIEELNQVNNLPKYLIMENVTALIGKKFNDQFTLEVKEPLEKLGYTNSVLVMKGSDYGIPQMRERVFMISSLDGNKFVEPPHKPLKFKLWDVYDKETEDKHIISDKLYKYFNVKEKNGFKRSYRPHNKESEIAYTITTRNGYVASENFFITPKGHKRLSPLETGRLMGMTDEEIKKQLSAVSMTQAWKQHGNGIIVDVFAEILKMIIEKENKT